MSKQDQVAIVRSKPSTTLKSDQTDCIVILMCSYCHLAIYTVQITHSLNGPHVSHACDKHGVKHTHVGFLDSTHVYMHIQYLHTCVHTHKVFIHSCFYTCACLYG